MPPRPQLSYTVEQHRAIVDGLVADRENARYTDQVIRYRSGQSSLPPPPAPPAAVAAVGAGGSDRAVPDRGRAGGSGGRRTRRTRTMAIGPSRAGTRTTRSSDFVDELARDTAEEPLAAPGSAGAAAADPEDAGDQGPGWLDWLGGLFGQRKVEAAPPADAGAAAPPAPAGSDRGAAPPGRSRRIRDDGPGGVAQGRPRRRLRRRAG